MRIAFTVLHISISDFTERHGFSYLLQWSVSDDLLFEQHTQKKSRFTQILWKREECLHTLSRELDVPNTSPNSSSHFLRLGCKVKSKTISNEHCTYCYIKMHWSVIHSEWTSHSFLKFHISFNNVTKITFVNNAIITFVNNVIITFVNNVINLSIKKLSRSGWQTHFSKF